jgi:hypothetical protein
MGLEPRMSRTLQHAMSHEVCVGVLRVLKYGASGCGSFGTDWHDLWRRCCMMLCLAAAGVRYDSCHD